MKRIAAICLFSIAAANAESASIPKSNSPSHATLRWENGEAISGELMEASDADVTWKTPLFRDSLVLRWPVVRRFDQPLASVPFTDPFDITLRDGSRLHGNLTSITADTLSIRSTRHGDAVLKRSEVLSILRVRGGSLLLAGPDGDVGWEVLAKENSEGRPVHESGLPLLTVGPGGALSMPYWNCGASLDVKLPELLDIEFRVHSSNRPDFQFLVKAGQGQEVTVETWDDELVFTVGDEFKLIRKIAANERDVEMRLCWDRKERKCSIFSPAGELLTEWQIPDGPKVSANRLILQNKGRDLSLEFLRIRAWDGHPPAKVDLKQPRVELADGSILEGQVSSGSNDGITLRTDGQDSDLDVPLAKVDAIIFSADSVRPAAHEATFSYADGTILMGRILWIKNGWAALMTSFADQPVVSNLASLRQLRLDRTPPQGPAPKQPFAGFDQLVIQKTTLHGTLACKGDRWPRWLPIGGVKPATPSDGMPIEMTRAFSPDDEVPATPALFYTTSGDVLPGNLLALDRSGAEFESGIMEKTELPTASLDAIQFGASVRSNVLGFGDHGWRILQGTKETVRQTGDSLAMEADTSFGHPSIMQSSEINFNMPFSGFCFVRLRMFCAGTDGTRSTKLILGFEGNRIISGLETSEGQLDDQTQTPVPSNKPVEVRLVVLEKEVELHLNGSLVQKFPIDLAKRAGVGLIIEPASLWGNSVERISLSGLSSTSSPGRTWVPDVNTEVKKEALTVPRSRRDAPPRHVLLAANGDVLRGEIEAMTLNHFGFRSGLETLHVPRDRVKAVLWLKKPQEDAAPAEKEQPALKILEQRIEGRRRYGSTNLTTLIQVLQQEAGDLKFKLPEKESNRTFQMQFGGQTIGEALEQICSMAGLHYRVDDKGTIILEAAPRTDGLVQKVYWLKTASFPDAPVVQEFLSTRGIPFPAGSTAVWQPDARQLLVTNTGENQGKLSKLLETELGGLSDAPTHWLLLTNGARFALTVDKFAEDSVSGHHPIYGRCNIPISQVSIIRNSMPEPTPTMRSLQNWHLTFAPEPVIPETGADASPSLGKEAKTFKLPLLGGGDFDLAKEKGKVVVLDFWATWCGPCVKALPGLIEAISAFPADQVKLIGVNQSEPEEQIKRFLETRGWKLTVALDAGQSVGQQYGVDGIPHTVIIGPDGKVAWVKTGYTPDGEIEAANAVKKLLVPSSSEPPKTPSP